MLRWAFCSSRCKPEHGLHAEHEEREPTPSEVFDWLLKRGLLKYETTWGSYRMVSESRYRDEPT